MKHVLLVGLAAVAACDSLATGDYRPPYLTIRGTIVQPTPPVPLRAGDTVRVALLWNNLQAPISKSPVQLLDAAAHFPLDFTLGITALPPTQVVYTLPPGTAPTLGIDPAMRWAVGLLIVYVDDGDQRFNIVGPNDPPSSDRVLAATSDLDIFWLGSTTPAPLDFAGIFPVAAGFSLVHEPRPRDPRPGECGRFTAQGHFSELCGPVSDPPTPLDPSTSVEEVELADDTRLQGFSCSAFWGSAEYADWSRATANQICDGGLCPYCRGYQCPLDLPAPGDPVRCSPDQTAYVFKHCVDDAAWCGTRFCHFGHGERMAADPPPAGWPCP